MASSNARRSSSALSSDPDLNVALGVALGGRPPGYWPIPALVALAIQIARGRTPVGPEITLRGARRLRLSRLVPFARAT